MNRNENNVVPDNLEKEQKQIDIKQTPRYSFAQELLAEFAGVFVLVFFGIGTVHASIFAGAQVGLWQVAVVWGGAVIMAVYISLPISGGHLNPALSIAFVLFRGFPLRKLPGYILSQTAGAFVAAAVIYLLFKGMIVSFEEANQIVRGTEESVLSAMAYGDYFPNPLMSKAMNWAPDVVSMPVAMLAEGLGTATLAVVVFALTEPSYEDSVVQKFTPIFIGVAIAVIVSVIAPFTQASLSPARDFGPKLFAWLMGWGSVALPGPRGGAFMVYILSPILGALAGATLFQMFLPKKTK